MRKLLPRTIGVGFKSNHFTDILDAPGHVGWVEVHAENYMGAGGVPRAQLSALRQYFPISVHGVGLALGGAKPPDLTHLARLRGLIDWIKPAQISEHIAWTGADGAFLNDLLPVDYSQDSLTRLCAHIDQAQQFLGRKMLIENPSSYLIFNQPNYDTPKIETDFLAALVDRTDCGLLLDVNNIYVSCVNLGWETDDYLKNFPFEAIGEVHLAGHSEDCDSAGVRVLIDNHGSPVIDEVWQLYQYVLRKAGAVPTLIEWDTNIPAWAVLQSECAKADALLQGAGQDPSQNQEMSA